MDLVALGPSYRQIDYWCRVGYLHPEKAAPGSGYGRRFTPAEAGIAVTMFRLVRAGLEPEPAHRVARSGGRLEIAPGVVVTVADHGHQP